MWESEQEKKEKGKIKMQWGRGGAYLHADQEGKFERGLEGNEIRPVRGGMEIGGGGGGGGGGWSF